MSTGALASEWSNSLYITNIKERNEGASEQWGKVGETKHDILCCSPPPAPPGNWRALCCVWEPCMLPSHFTFAKGEMKLVMQTRPASVQTAWPPLQSGGCFPLSQGENPRFLLRPWRMLSHRGVARDGVETRYSLPEQNWSLFSSTRETCWEQSRQDWRCLCWRW